MKNKNNWGQFLHALVVENKKKCRAQYGIHGKEPYHNIICDPEHSDK